MADNLIIWVRKKCLPFDGINFWILLLFGSLVFKLLARQNCTWKHPILVYSFFVHIFVYISFYFHFDSYSIYILLHESRLSKYCTSCNTPFKVRPPPQLCLTNRSICSSATPHQLLQRTSALHTLAFLEDTQMSLFSSNSIGQGSNQQLSFLGKPRAFCKELWKAPCIHVLLYFLLRITELRANNFQELIQAARVLPCPVSHTNKEKFQPQHGLGITPPPLLLRCFSAGYDVLL